MSKHTPGPWELSEAAYKEGFGTYRRVEQVQEFGDVVASVCIRHAVNHTLDACGDANARLIAAAPDLLAVLSEFKTASDKQDSTFDGSAWLDRVDAAIAKATGGSA